jgi:acyl carrier protein
MSSIAATVFTVIAQELGLLDTAINPAQSTQTLEELGADSLDLTCITMELERKLDLDIPDDIVRTWTTVQSVIDSLTLLAGAVGKADAS